MRVRQFGSAVDPCAAEGEGVEVQFPGREEGEDGTREEEGEEEGAERVGGCGWVRAGGGGGGGGVGGGGGGGGLGHGAVEGGGVGEDDAWWAEGWGEVGCGWRVGVVLGG